MQRNSSEVPTEYEHALRSVLHFLEVQSRRLFGHETLEEIKELSSRSLIDLRKLCRERALKKGGNKRKLI